MVLERISFGAIVNFRNLQVIWQRLRSLFIFGLGGLALAGQTLINLGAQARNADLTNQPYTRTMKTGTVLPSTAR